MAVRLPLHSRSQWRVSPENPVRFENRLDYERCAALHNELLEIGWTGSGRCLLSDDLISFLERARMIRNRDSGSFFYYVYGFMSPKGFWQNTEPVNVDEGRSRYLTLYGANPMASHPDGLVFDLQTNRAIIQMSIHDSSVTHNGRVPWYPLEVVLSNWLEMVDMGVIKAVTEEVDVLEKFDPWICLHWNEHQVEETLSAFSLLVENIENRMPPQVSSASSHSRFLVPEELLDAAKIPTGFARSFLSKAKRPRLKHIAPGLIVPDVDTFLPQPFTHIEMDDEDEDDDVDSITTRPVLLFRSSETFNAGSVGDPVFMPPFNNLQTLPAGLYLEESERQAGHAFEGGARLILPFGIGGNGFARTSDGLQIGDASERKEPSCGNRHAELYQQGCNLFIEMHDVRLVKILESWTGMIQRGDWKVGVEGVEGSIEAFKEADTEQNWQKFVVPVSW